jgi:hypothetical protein
MKRLTTCWHLIGLIPVSALKLESVAGKTGSPRWLVRQEARFHSGEVRQERLPRFLPEEQYGARRDLMVHFEEIPSP